MHFKRTLAAGSWRSTVHLVTGLALAPLCLLAVVGAIVGVVSVPLQLVGVPVLVLGRRGVGAVTRLMERRLAHVTGVPVGRAATDLPHSARELLTGRSGWRELAICLVGAIWMVTTGGLVVGAYVLGGTLLSLPFTVPAVGPATAVLPLQFPAAGVELLGAAPQTWWSQVLAAGAGAGVVVAALVGAAPLVRLEAYLLAWLRDPAGRRRLWERIDTLEAVRTKMLDATEAERRRIERDLHDGAQQRLLAVSIGISRASRQLDRDPGKVRELLVEAHGDARAAIDELRSIARSSHPPVLTEQGLPAAVSSLAHRCLVPVQLQVEIDERPARRTEAVAYYVLSELLTNVAKHASASTVTARIWRDADRLRLRVVDDGRGGADEKPGGGLAGLRARLDALDGDLTITSPCGRGTIGEAELRWAA